jgi:FixJ family two-component response regulator
MSSWDRERGSRVFVVDDDGTLRTALARLLRSVGYVVETFASAEDFLASGRGRERGALLVDVRMPGMSGPALHGKLAREGSGLHTFLMSAVEDEQVRRSALAAGACGWFNKPLDAKALVAELVARGCLPAPASMGSSGGALD